MIAHGGFPCGSTTEYASSDECAFERSIAVHSTATKASRFSGRVQALDGFSIGSEHSAAEVCLESSKALSGEHMQFDRVEWTRLWILQLVRWGNPNEFVSEIVPRISDRGKLEVFGELVRIGEVSLSHRVSHGIAIKRGIARALHLLDEIIEGVCVEKINPVVNEGLNRPRGTFAESLLEQHTH